MSDEQRINNYFTVAKGRVAVVQLSHKKLLELYTMMLVQPNHPDVLLWNSRGVDAATLSHQILIRLNTTPPNRIRGAR